jgi:hypothetical protein
MWLILSAATDPSALWAYQGLQSRGLEPLEWVTAESLAAGVRWEHRLGAAGVSVDITLADGRRIRDTELRGVLNRLAVVPQETLLLIHPSDRDYVYQEWNAFFLSWLNALPPPVVNRPMPWGLSGRWRHVSEWIYLAAQAGLPVPHYQLSSRDFSDPFGVASRLVPARTPVQLVLVVGQAATGDPAPPAVQAGCLRLAELAQTTLLGVEFVTGPDDTWQFVGATPHPDLRPGGEALLDALAHLLRGEPEVRP